MPPSPPTSRSAADTIWTQARTRAVQHQHLLKYLVIGATASGLDVVLFLLLYNGAGTSAVVAHSISVPTSVLFSFAFNARHNFRTTDHVALRLASFVVVATIGYLAGYGVIELAAYEGLGANAGKILSLPVVFAIQYLLNSRITFHKPKVLDLELEKSAS
ncbi:GtrA family protein [Chthonobacter rhizosphaerae]|uniref:GtrA family protein n=1 Tax=Chthonobacter rhizosphaerae TaxID=2735553 RepID=UPI0015EE6E98|nr:GtrA family protein [Chthonobacter rhizosphaerae]